MEKIIIDTDIGVDDALAISYAAYHCKIIGITTVFGNVSAEQAVKNARLFTKIIGHEIPIYRGMSRPLVLEPTPVNKSIHGEDGLGGIFDNPFDGKANDAISFMVDAIMNHPREITLLPIGPLTNIASALNLEPEIADKVKQVIIMGGAFGTKGNQGNVTPLSEFNIWKDPHAADQVLSSKLPVTMIPLDVTHKVLVTGEEIRQTHQPHLIEMTKGYLQYSMEKEGFDGMALHDALTVAYLLHPEQFTTIRSPLRVVTEGVAIGMTLNKVTEMASRTDPFKGLRQHNICVDVNSENVKRHLLTTLKNNKE